MVAEAVVAAEPEAGVAVVAAAPEAGVVEHEHFPVLLVEQD